MIFEILKQTHIRRLGWNKLLVTVNRLDMSFHITRINKLLSAILTRERFVEMIAKRLLAQLFFADSTNEILGVTLQVFANMHLERFL